MEDKEIQERYKHIEVEKQGDITIVKLYRSENIDDKIYFVRIVFVDNKLFYSGDMGTYVFGKDIVNIFNFFKGNKINVDYWAGKCEACSYPIFPNEVDEDLVEENVKDYLCEFFGVEKFEELDDEIKEKVSDQFQFGIETNDIRAYDKVYEFLEEHFNQPNLGEYVCHIIDGAKETSGNFVYACEVIQWVENNLEKWLEVKENLVFHNLIKNPNDLPKNDNKILFFAKDISCVENHYLNRYSLGNYDTINKLFVANSPGYSKDFTITEVLYWWELEIE